MRLLLDTHAFLWSIHGDKRLSKNAKEAFLDTENKLYLSAVSYWEICIKQSLGKLGLVPDWQRLVDTELAANGIEWLTIEKTHCRAVLHLPILHRDPFDRLLVAQAQVEDMTLLTEDGNIRKYSVETIW